MTTEPNMPPLPELPHQFDILFGTGKAVRVDVAMTWAASRDQQWAERVAELERDRAEWKDATISANTRFKMAEEKLRERDEAIDAEQAKGREAAAHSLPDEWPREFIDWYRDLPDMKPESLWWMWAKATCSKSASDAYDKIDRFLRNNLDDSDYAEYSDALDDMYTPPAQPAREWVGLSDDEVIEIGNETHRAMPDDADDQQELLAIYQNIESELREKNAGQPVKED